jgi:hypothetical protein
MSETTQDDYNNLTYEDLSTEFQALFPKAMRAHQLISLMYDRLTLVDKLSHTQAVKKSMTTIVISKVSVRGVYEDVCHQTTLLYPIELGQRGLKKVLLNLSINKC